MKNKYLSINILIFYTITILVAVSFTLYMVYYNDAIVESHAYRQTQTAIVSFWMLRNNFNVLNYLMPVLGYPWSAPLEFPLYQFIVAKIVEVTGYGLEIVGRSVSLFFFYFSLLPILLILQKYGNIAVTTSLILYLSSPIGLIYSRSFLIENTALFFSLFTFAIYIQLKRRNFYDTYYCILVGLFVIFGIISGLQKITTFFPVFLICVLDNLTYLKLRSKFIKNNIKIFILTIFLSLSILPALIYSKYSDSIKQLGIITDYLLSSSQNSWIFGDIYLRLSMEYWLKVFGYRLILLGGVLVPVIWIIFLIIKKKKSINREAVLAIFIGLIGPLLFGPLFYTHDYYFVASISFIIIGLSIYLSEIIKFDKVYIFLIYSIIILNYSIFYNKYLPKLNNHTDIDRTSIEVGKFLKSNLNDGEVSLIIGMDWSSVIPYYSENYAIMIPAWLPNKSYIIRNVENYTGGFSIGAFVICRNNIWPIDITSNELLVMQNNFKGKMINIGSCNVLLKN